MTFCGYILCFSCVYSDDKRRPTHVMCVCWSLLLHEAFPHSCHFPLLFSHSLSLTQHLSLLIIIIAIILAVCKVVTYAFFWLSLSGTSIAWIYLRFYQKKDQGGRGDMSESFAFATFFPEMFQPPLATLGGFVYHLLVSIRVCPKTVRTYDVGAPSTIKLTLPGTDPADAQRRK